jgi:hypothetical protein
MRSPPGPTHATDPLPLGAWPRIAASKRGGVRLGKSTEPNLTFT